MSLSGELSILLEHSGYMVNCINDFTDVYTQLVSATADLILLDISLPGENGEMLLQRQIIREDN